MNDREIVDQIFNQYVFKFIEADIRREIQMAELSEGHTWIGPGDPPSPMGGGNLLAALGLLCYTEFLGSFISAKTKGYSRRNFEAFFDRLGLCYQQFANAHDVYEIFRCGMVHEYAVKRDCTIYMRTGAESCGLGVDANGRYYFVVERYFKDFRRAARELHAELQAKPVLPK